ncbi:hypothetical protein [Listeria valentina]|uniref:hypothetical protein n=1 Tax=Listeria valentina TaxID=2705293 RepID=UPI0014305288|nr:hypothetical protein [Listeria valentina]
MYGNTYERERARALGDASGEYKYQAGVLKERLKSKDLTPAERANMIAAERELVRKAQKIALKRAVNKGAEKIESDLSDTMKKLQKDYPTAQEDLTSLQRELKDAFDSKTGDAVQEWLVTKQADSMRNSQDDLYSAW